MNTIKKAGQIFVLLLILLCIYFQSQSSIVVLNGLTHENVAQKGDIYRGIIQIQNTGQTSRSVKVYQNDYWYSYSGESKHDPPGTMERSNAKWININPELLTLAPNEISVINFEVVVPVNEDLAGTYWSVIMVEGISEPDTTRPETGVKINTAIRYAVQVITNIGNTGQSDLSFLGMELTKKNDASLLLVAIENIGERLLKPDVKIELFDESGNSVATIIAEKRKILPGTSIKSTLIFEGVKPGNYTGVLVADCGEDNIFGTNLSFALE